MGLVLEGEGSGVPYAGSDGASPGLGAVVPGGTFGRGGGGVYAGGVTGAAGRGCAAAGGPGRAGGAKDVVGGAPGVV